MSSLKALACVYVGVACCAILNPATASAQQPSRWTVTAAAGASLFDLGGASEASRSAGTGVIAAARLEYAFARQAIAELGVSHFQYTDNRGTHRHILPEANVQYADASGAVRPYIGMGGGAYQWTVASVHGVLGTRLRLAPRWQGRIEARGRAVFPLSGWLDLTGGAGWTF